MHYRELGKTGAKVSEVGMGCNRLGQSYESDDFWTKLVLRAADLGVTVFDTAEAYGWGRSEEILGKALGNRDDVMVATKMCRIRESGEQEYSPARMVETVEGSLRKLQRDVIDIYQLHSPRRDALERYDWAEGMQKLREQGKIRFSAVAVSNEADALWLMEQDLVDVLQITYSIFHTEPEKGLFAMAEVKGVGLLCRMPLARGVLTGKFRLGEEVGPGHRALLDGDQVQGNIRRAESLRPISASRKGGMTRMALQFSLSPKAVSAIIPGARTWAQVEENIAASDGMGLSEQALADIAAVQAGWA
ncbi:MAG: aldo/keto reductase [Anaerolineae bacterium]|nr:aldo/keto reductase [Anaerolineae bacterium]